MGDQLARKTRQYEELLSAACADADLTSPEDTPLGRLGREHLEMALAYLEDGKHFSEEDDPVNALAAYAYGHGWLDAAIRGGLVAGATPREG